MPSDIPNLKQSAAPMPRTEKPAHVTPGSTETGQDDDLPELVEQLLDFCIERDLPPNSPMDEVAEQFLAEHTRGGKDADPTRQHLVDDEEPLDDEVIERVMRHAKAKLSPSAAQGLEDLLRSAPGADDDDMPEPLRGTKQGERLAEYLDGKDRHSFSDRIEAADAVGQAIELMRKTAGSAGDRRVARDMPPPFPGRPTPGGHPLPGRQERYGIDRKKQIAADAAFFGMKKKAVKRRHKMLSGGI